MPYRGMRWWRLFAVPSSLSNMPGTPYIDTPPGLLTWPRLLKRTIPPLLAFLTIAAYNDVLLKAMALMTLTVLLLGRWASRRGSVENSLPIGENHDGMA